MLLCFSLICLFYECSGYVSPEYAMDGLFSEKSDVYSFGVLSLEIISGRKNTGFQPHEQALSLLELVCQQKLCTHNLQMIIFK